VDIARNHQTGPVQIGDIALRQNISVKYLEQLVRPLKKAKLVSSVRGPRGGYIMAQSPTKITLGQVVRIFEGASDIVAGEDASGSDEMEDDSQVQIAWKNATAAMRAELDTITISDLSHGKLSTTKT